MNQTLKNKIETMKPFDLQAYRLALGVGVATLGRYHGKAVIIISVNEYWNEALIRYAHPEPPLFQKNRFKISLNLLKEF